MRLQLGLTVGIVLNLLFLSILYAGTLYRWVDEKGVTHISDQLQDGQLRQPENVQKVEDVESDRKQRQQIPLPAPAPSIPSRHKYLKRGNGETSSRLSQSSSASYRDADVSKSTSLVAGEKASQNAICGFPGLRIPSEATIYAAGGYGSEGKKLSYYIDQSGHKARQVDVVVNEPLRSVVLLLSAYEPMVWNINWSPGSRILAVAAVGGNRQIVSGLPKQTPLLLSQQGNRAGPCETLYVAPARADEIEKVHNLKALDRVANKLYGRNVDQVRYIEKDGRVIIGDLPGAGTSLQHSRETHPNSFHDPKLPLVGRAALQDAIKKGLLRPATTEDQRKWDQEYAKANPRRNVFSDDGKPRSTVLFGTPFETFVIIKPYVFPPDLYGGNAATFMVLKGVPFPTGDPGHSTVYDFNTLTCKGPLPDCDDFRPQQPITGNEGGTPIATRQSSQDSQAVPKANKTLMKREKAKSLSASQAHNCRTGCCFPDLQLPENAVVYAAGPVGNEGWPLKFQIDQSGANAKRIDVKVNETNRPVALLLSSYGPTIWNISWSVGTKLLAVAAVGQLRQAIAGLPKDVPQLSSDNGFCDAVYMIPRASSEAAKAKNLQQIDTLTSRLFGRGVDSIIVITSGTAQIGKPQNNGAKMISSPQTSPESFFNAGAPLAGKPALQEAMQKGLLRKATYQDVKDWETQYAIANGKRDVFPKDTTKSEPSPGKEYDDIYVVLKPFVFPKGITGFKAIFYVPRGVPYPTGNPGHICVHDFTNLRRTGACP